MNSAETRALDALLEDDGRWPRFYDDRARPCPFFTADPDENLAAWIADGTLARGRALDLGCGNGRNAVALARAGCAVDAVDLSPAALAWAREQAAGLAVGLRCGSVFELAFEAGAYDVVYDSGCFHHLAPHRRADYIALVARALRPGGTFGLVCFAPEGGSGYTDAEVYARRSLGGGLGYDAERLRALWSEALVIDELRRMREPAPAERLFGRGFLWVLRAHRA